MAGRLEGKIAAITGAASGLGEATARRFVDEGATVIVADIQDERGAAVADTLGPRATFQRCDVTAEADVAALVDAAVAAHGRLDVMFNNAGIVGAIGPIDETPVDEWDLTTAVLLRSVFLGCKHAARVMKPQGSGVILSTSSIAGVQGGLGPHAYAAAKHAVIGLTKNVAAELGAWGVRAVGIAPGKHVTPMNADVMLGDPNAVDQVEERFTRMTPLVHRPGLADDIANAAVYLASDEAGFVSGTTLVVDGGLTTGSPEDPTPGQGRWGGSHRPMIREGGRRGTDG
jgi:NAD(P)-dependent dehydrogenase (short-subunit alcohol dehydrogenase family)